MQGEQGRNYRENFSKAFVEHYYTTFCANPVNLGSLYQESSMLTFQGEQFQGSQNIVARLNNLPFQQCKYKITSVDCQYSGPAGDMLVFVSGSFQHAAEGSFFYVLNEIFRLNYA
ncbi:hypothetical protein MKW94_022079 [Papaver nudicaule]|uniref:NTF2 domain-containing protein n=1 Tax=Papaver nudicaule TaxID=74823 RepID=A0AA41SI70_PAPNU|nr:hypothetical protein [Papaver nudicaule]